MKRELYQFTPEVYPFNLWIYVGKDVSGDVSGMTGKCEDVKKGTVRDKLIWESK